MSAMGAGAWTWAWAGGPAVVDAEFSWLLEHLLAPELLWELALLLVPGRMPARWRVDSRWISVLLRPLAETVEKRRPGIEMELGISSSSILLVLFPIIVKA